ncbi:MAG: cytochrome c [Chitinophagales bacterium]|nr:cytochrome c [Chitinophagales bacterium]
MVIIFLISCRNEEKTNTVQSDSNDITTQKDIARGKELFKKNCASCHGENNKVIANSFQEIRNYYDFQWIIGFIRSNDSLLKIKDPRATYVFNIYNLSVMPKFKFLTQKDVIDILDYVDSFPLNTNCNEHWKLPIKAMRDSNLIMEKNRKLLLEEQLRQIKEQFGK